MDKQKCLQTYSQQMALVKHRMAACEFILARVSMGQSASYYAQTDLNSLADQKTRIIEHILYAGTVANHPKTKNEIRSTEEAFLNGNIFDWANERNPDYFPQAVADRVEIEINDLTGEREEVHIQTPITKREGYAVATKSGLQKIYKMSRRKFSDITETDKYNDPSKQQRIFENIAFELSSIKALLEVHTTVLAEKFEVFVEMNDSESQVRVMDFDFLYGDYAN